MVLINEPADSAQIELKDKSNQYKLKDIQELILQKVSFDLI